ncbi:MAG: hypothetical protein R3F34_14880 [Planctomycetota bacterium]
MRCRRGGPGARRVRELDRAERVAVVRLFVEAAARVLAGRGRLDAEPVPSRTAAELRRLAGRTGFARRARACLWARLGDWADHEELALLAELADRPRRRWPEASRILGRARLVLDGPVLAHLQAYAFEREDDLATALSLWSRVSDRASNRRSATRALEYVGRAHLAAGRPRLSFAALDAVVVAGARGTAMDLDLAAAWFAACLRLGDGRRALALADAIDGVSDGVSSGGPSDAAPDRPGERELRNDAAARTDGTRPERTVGNARSERGAPRIEEGLARPSVERIAATSAATRAVRAASDRAAGAARRHRAEADGPARSVLLRIACRATTSGEICRGLL